MNNYYQYLFEIPILFQIFNRIDTSQRVFNEIRKVKPRYLFIAQDAARPDIHGEDEKCRVVRETIEKQIDWECDLKTLYRENNLGPGAGTANAIQWFFDQVEMGIVLEHDCLPHPHFFPYCEELLIKYKNNSKIKLINGSAYHNYFERAKQSYYFGVSGQLWGWAAWNYTFNNYKQNIGFNDKEEIINSINNTFKTKRERKYWESKIYRIFNKKSDTWDYQLMFTIWKENGLIIIPQKNLISNIGFGEEAIHCKNEDSKIANAPTFDILPLIHPIKIKRNYKVDRSYHDIFLGPKKSILHRIKIKILDYFPQTYYIYQKIFK